MVDRYLLDTNVAVRVMNGVVDLDHRGEGDIEAFLSLTVVGELFFGAAKSGRPEQNRARIESLVERCPVAPMELATAVRYGRLKADLHRKGRPIPENDLWIAACALHHGLILATQDRHFAQVDGLRTEAW